MSQAIEVVETELRARPRRWLVTGFAGFIGSHLTEHLLALGQHVVGLDNFSTGHHHNIEALVEAAIARGAEDADDRLFVIEADVRDFDGVLDACAGVDHVLHHAAVASVPRTIEDRIGRPLSPYAAHKRVAEVLGQATTRTFGLPIVALRYFNIVGPRQDPNGAYAAVIPKWSALLAKGEQPAIFGDGLNTRDFCPVEDVVQANLLAATWLERTSTAQRERPGDTSEAVFNIGLGQRTNLLELYAMIHAGMVELGAPCAGIEARHEPPRAGDIVHSLADIARARTELGYAPRTSMAAAIRNAMRSLV